MINKYKYKSPGGGIYTRKQITPLPTDLEDNDIHLPDHKESVRRHNQIMLVEKNRQAQLTDEEFNALAEENGWEPIRNDKQKGIYNAP